MIYYYYFEFELNSRGPSKNISVQLLDQVISVVLEAESIVTIEFVPQNYAESFKK